MVNITGLTNGTIHNLHSFSGTMKTAHPRSSRQHTKWNGNHINGSLHSNCECGCMCDVGVGVCVGVLVGELGFCLRGTEP